MHGLRGAAWSRTPSQKRPIPGDGFVLGPNERRTLPISKVRPQGSSLPREMAAFVLFPHPQRAEAHKVSRALAEAAVAAGLTPVVPAEHSAIFQSLSGIEFRSGHDLGAGCSFTASVGGDGSLLHAFAQVPDLPMVGIHAGELGYLTTVLPDDIDALVAAAVEERLEFVDLSVLDVTYEGETILALNDAVIAKGPDGRAPKLRLPTPWSWPLPRARPVIRSLPGGRW
ncbi:MAG: hypothetical protein DYH08_14215 [Actinobacteria bacterium ATB1]|nr:hypothetical protein [Actinobacteria bacterium ATB1]